MPATMRGRFRTRGTLLEHFSFRMNRGACRHYRERLEPCTSDTGRAQETVIRQRSRASVLTPFVNEILDAETAERDAFAQFADVGHGLGGSHCLGGHDGWILLGEGFQGAGYYLLG